MLILLNDAFDKQYFHTVEEKVQTCPQCFRSSILVKIYSGRPLIYSDRHAPEGPYNCFTHRRVLFDAFFLPFRSL